MHGLGASGKATAWYVIPGRSCWVRWLNVLHWPYTLWHLSYVALGALLAPGVRWDVLGWAVLAYFLAVGVAAHCYDLLRGDPLAVGLPRRHLWWVAHLSLAGAAAVGVLNILWGNIGPVAWIPIALGVLMVVGYNLEWPGMHGNVQFALFWGVFPFAVGAYAAGDPPPPVAAAAAGMAFAFATSYAQRALSERARYLRRRVVRFEGVVEARDGVRGGDLTSWSLRPLDLALAYLSFGHVILAVALSLAKWLS